MKIIKMIHIIYIVLFVLFCSSCANNEKKDDYSIGEKIMRTILYPFRSGNFPFLSKKEKSAKDLYNAVYGYYIDDVKKLLDEGVDPNYCRGECGWIDANPLNVVAEGFYYTYYRKLRGDTIPDPAPDIQLLNLLLKAGADINRRPYVWDRVYLYNNSDFDDIKRQRIADNESIDPVAMKAHIDSYIADVNRLLEAFIKAGADVDKKGHPYPYDWAKTKGRMTDKEAEKYFLKGSRAINTAIEKGILWESQVDLLLKYTRLDEESLKAAERSNDSKMIDKIKKLWQRQQQSGKEKN